MENEDKFTFEDATRHAVPQIISISGVSGSGKTYSGILLGAGLAGDSGKVAFLDTENGRGSMYADSPGIRAALPNGYKRTEMSAPFHPNRYVKAIDAAERAGFSVLVIDSGSHAWEGEGGCSDIAEKDKGRWKNAKRENKRLVNRLLYSSMHIIVCLRAREKSKIVKTNGKEETISLGILPICEKNFPFEMLLSFRVEEETNLAIPLKCPEPLRPLFREPKKLTRADGEAIRLWNETGALADPHERLKKRARSIAEDGVEAYHGFFVGLPKDQQKALAASIHGELKEIAAKVDAERVQSDADKTVYTDGFAPDLQPV